MSTLINRRKVKAYALAMAGMRAHKFSRVGSEFFLKCENHLKEFIRQQIQRLPSRGKTIN